MAAAAQPKKYVAALDVGTTTVRCHILDKTAKVVGSATRQVTVNLFFIFAQIWLFIYLKFQVPL
jgi:glycerol kinase